LMTAAHVPVMVGRVADLLVTGEGGVFVDCTVGEGGHAQAVLERAGPRVVLIGIDRDRRALEAARARLEPLGGTVRLHHGSYADVASICGDYRGRVGGILFDLGVSSFQVDDPGRGFSYSADGPLDMRYDASAGETAADLLNRVPRRELARILKEYGEERWASRIASFIDQARRRRPISTTGELVEIVKDAVPAAARRSGGHPARRTFQALRIAVNDELAALAGALRDAVELLRGGGRIVALSYHSLEDRIVKRTFAELAGKGPGPPVPVRAETQALLRVLTRKPERPGADEVQRNPRSRSARLRAAERLG